MPLFSFLQRSSSIASALPGSAYAAITILQARSALQSGLPARAVEIAEMALAGLEDKEQTPPSLQIHARFAPIAQAALRALLATALKRIGNDSVRTESMYHAADDAFSSMLNATQGGAIPFMGDYVLMLAEFGATERAVELAGQLGQIAQGTGAGQKDIRPALTFLNRAALLNPTARMLTELGLTLLAQNHREEASDVFLNAAGVAVASNDQAAALEAVEKAMEISHDGGARRMRGVIRWRAGDVKGACEDFSAAVEQNADDFVTRVALAHAWLKLKDPDKALAELDIVLSSQPEHSDALWLHGSAELQIGERYAAAGNESDRARACWAAAIQNFTEALKGNPKHAACRRSRAAAYFQLGQLNSAENDINEALKLDPDDVSGHALRAEILFTMKDYDQALSAVNAALALVDSQSAPEGTRAHLLSIKGLALLETKWLDDAILALREAVVLDPCNEDGVIGLMHAYELKRDWPGLAKCARELQDNTGAAQRAAQLRKTEVSALRITGDYAAAFTAMERGPVLDHPDLVWLKGRLLADIGNFETARAVLSDIAQNLPGLIDHLSLRGWVIQNLEPSDPDHRVRLAAEGRSAYEAAYRLAVKDPNQRSQAVWIQKGLANALLRSPDSKKQAWEEYEKVIDACEELLTSTKTNVRMLNLIGWCYYCRDEYGTALRYYDAAQSTGEQSLAGELDYALVSWVAAQQDSVQRYRKAIQRAEKENIFRRIGALRVSLHDLREIVFRKPELVLPIEIQQHTCRALRRAMASMPALPGAFLEHLSTFMELVDALHPSEDHSSQSTVI